MKIFHWHSEALRNYSSGDLIAIADDEPTAREMVRRDFPNYYKEYRWGDWSIPAEKLMDENDHEELAQAVAKMETDISKPANVCETLFIQGGE